MTGKAEASLKQLSSLARSLNEASDQLAQQIGVMEAALNSYKLGVWAWVRTPILSQTDLSEPDGDGRRYEITYEHRLGYGKHNNKWGLLVSSGWDFDDENTQIAFLRDASREIRLRAMDKMPELLEVIVKETASITDEASKKAAEAKEFAAALSKKSR